jgi:hypothetical protein
LKTVGIMRNRLIQYAAVAIGLSATAAIMLQAAEPAQEAKVGNGAPAFRFEGYTPPPSIPGYGPSTDPRDFTGVWRNRPLPGADRFAIAKDMPLTAPIQKLSEARKAQVLKANATSIATPHIMCRPTGLNQALAPIAPIYILQNDSKVVFIVTDEIRNVRQVHLAAAHPATVVPSYGGHSIAHWEKNTLVVDTIGYNGRGEMAGITHSAQMHLVERISKSADGTVLTIDATFEDPAVLSKVVNVKKEWAMVNGQQPLEFDCEENPREDNFADMLFLEEYLRPICIQHETQESGPSKVVCEKPTIP